MKIYVTSNRVKMMLWANFKLIASTPNAHLFRNLLHRHRVDGVILLYAWGKII